MDFVFTERTGQKMTTILSLYRRFCFQLKELKQTFRLFVVTDKWWLENSEAPAKN